MRCYCCDSQLSSDEIKRTPAYGRGGFSPCGKCLDIIETVFEPASEEEIDQQLLAEELFYEELQDNAQNAEISP